jgi:transcription initiation factor TFIIIB Brf1 subunit/transcription initiation factor TFIIB
LIGRRASNSVTPVTAEEWIASFASELGAEPPDATEVEQILDLAAVAAHSSERVAAPLACWLAGRTGIDLAKAEELAERIG